MACPLIGCGGTNSARYNFCQWCGNARVLVELPASPAVINEEAIAARLAVLRGDLARKAHTKSKCAEFDGFQLFLASRQNRQCRREGVLAAIPGDVAEYLIHRDVSGKGKTLVHDVSCMTRSTTGCDCPLRMASDTLRGIASKVRTRLYEIGCSGAWDAVQGSGNPADSMAVSQLLASVDEEQAAAGCRVLMARDRALLPGKFSKLIQCMRSDANRSLAARSYADYIRLLQDLAWFCVQFRSLNRGAELSELRAGQTVFGPNGCCAVFQFTWSKVIRDSSKTHAFAVQARPSDDTCPVMALRMYLRMTARFSSWDWEEKGRWVFPQVSSDGKPMAVPMTAQAMGRRFQVYLRKYNMCNGEGLHGLRAGGALSMALAGASLQEIMLRGFWSKPETARRYIGLLQDAVGPEFGVAVRARLGESYAVEAFEASAGASPFSFLDSSGTY